jgi:glycosyltransferase involved in cell wall biosynthesis
LVEAVVSDNCSTDDTRQVAESLKPNFKHFVYSANEKNIGFDLNILNVVKKSSGKYCWYLGDDDVIVNGGLQAMCNVLLAGDYSFIGINAKPLLDGDESYKLKQGMSADNLAVLDDYNAFFFADYCQAAVSVLAFNRELWLANVNLEGYLEHWLYYEAVLRVLVAGKKPMAYIKDVFILTGQDCRWAENGTELFTFINSNVLWQRLIVLGFDRERLTERLKTNRRSLVLILLKAKACGLNCDWANLKFIYQHRDFTGFFYLFVATLVYFIPNNLIALAKDFKKSF